MKTHIVALHKVAHVLDQIEVAVCVFDLHDCTLLWNHTFLQFFPEHAGHVHAGEHYSENLRRFYRQRLTPEEAPMLERYVEEGIRRHHTQQQAYEFDHRDNRVRVASAEIPQVGRIRVWRRTALLTAALPRATSDLTAAALRISAEAADALESLADGALVADHAGNTVWANQRFFELYRLMPSKALIGAPFEQLYIAAWQGREPTDEYQAGLHVLKERQRFAGAPYELPLPDQRWVRVVERKGTHADGRGYSTHVDITALKRQQEELERLTVRFESLSVTDALTGLANRRRFDEALEAEWLRARREHHPLSLILIDVDHFKQINDVYGHPYGDEVLKAIAKELARHLRRASDLVARYGGEEFAVLLPGTDLSSAFGLAEHLREAIQKVELGREGRSITVTISCGVSCALAEDLQGSSEALVDRADAALYQAKRSGRNRVVRDGA